MNYYDLIIMLLLASIVMVGIKTESVEDKSEILMRLNKLRGVFAIVIVIGHSIQGHMEHTYLTVFEKILCVSVAFFFFVSAYGITVRAISKSDYFKGFLVRKIGYILYLAVVAYVVELLTNVVIYHNHGFDENIIIGFFKYTNWYVWEVIGFYILLRIVFGILKSHRGIVLLLIALVIGAVMYKFNMYEPYYTAILAFPIGVIVGERENDYYKLVNSKLIYLLAGSLLVCGLGCFVFPEGLIIRDFIMRNCMGLGVIVILIFIVTRINPGNVVLDFLTKHSAEIYIFQFIWIRHSNRMGYSYKVVLIYILGMTMLCAVLFHRISEKVKLML